MDNRIKRTINLLRRNFTHRHFQEIHVETVLNPKCFDVLLRYAEDHPETMLMLIGPYEPWIKARIQAQNLSDEEYGEVLADRYGELAEVTSNFGLHAHLFHPQSVNVPSYLWQLNKITDARIFVENLGFKIEDFAPGWWGYNMDTVKACWVAGIKRFHYDGFFKLDPYRDMDYIEVWRTCDDFQLC